MAPERRTILVTGGAGYIGSHVTRQLCEAGRSVVVLDDLSTGHEDAVLGARLVVGDVSDRVLVSRLLDEHDVGAVLHFAASVVVPESVADPLKYYANNTCAARNLLECCVRAGVGRFVFSSTAAVYGEPESGRASESSPTAPVNPYGRSKLMTEQMLRDVAAASGMRYVALRYFNVAGADPGGRIGQSTPGATHLIKVACEVATGKRPSMAIFGTDYPTADGTCVRDYIHVEDLARAHLAALEHLDGAGESLTLNCGYGRGYSVREVLAAVEAVAGHALAVDEAPRRPGDPPVIVAVSERIRETLGWEPRLDDLATIVRDAHRWETKLREREGNASDAGDVGARSRTLPDRPGG